MVPSRGLLAHFRGISGEFSRPPNLAPSLSSPCAEPLRTECPYRASRPVVSCKPLIFLYNARISFCPGPSAAMGPMEPPVGESPRPPVAHPGQTGPETRAGPGDPACRRWGEGFGRDDLVGGWAGAELAPRARRRGWSGWERGRGSVPTFTRVSGTSIPHFFRTSRIAMNRRM